jgi:hypothetical protein
MTTPGTVDITNLVSSMQSTFVTWATNLAFAAIVAVPGLSFLGLPVISSILRYALSWVIGKIAADAALEAFFLNTAVRNASNAQDYVDAINAKNSLSETATDAEYLVAEQNEMAAFHNFVVIGS